MKNAEIARLFAEMAQLLEIKGESVFRVRGYEAEDLIDHVALERSLTARSRAFAHYVIAHEFAHALLWNRGRPAGEDPEVAADSLAAAWGFLRPATLPLLIPLTQPFPRERRRRR